MAKLKLSGKDLRAIGYPEGPVISVAMQTMTGMHKHTAKDEVIDILKNILLAPQDFLEDEKLSGIASLLMPKPSAEGAEVSLNKQGVSFQVFGAEFIEAGAMNQMYHAAKLPVSVAGALMPDAHHGYGLPIGGVLAVDNAVIPYGVGVDIGCRMALSIFAKNPDELHQRNDFYVNALHDATLFGGGKQFETSAAHPVLDREEFNELTLLKSLQGRAAKQLGSSGSGNHFVEFGVVNIEEKDEVLGVPPGSYLGLLSHSGSRALGAAVANHYTKVAKQKRRLPGEASNLAWLGLDEEEGQEYWLAMNLAGDYAAACHHIIHEKIARKLGERPIKKVENHHNFAWKEMLDGKEVIVHRKGATPAGKNVLGIIPGSMTAPGFIVKGKGETGSINSASHGAGRQLSRTAAINSITQHAMNEVLQQHGVQLMGGGVDEAPAAYKDINLVMQAQHALVEVLGSFTPKIVRMDGAEPKQWQQKKLND